MYYKADGTRQFGSIIELQSQKEVAIEDITPLVRGSEADSLGTLNIDNFLIKTRAVSSDSISHSTARYSYNPDGRCGSVAGAIVLNYYDRYKSPSYVPNSLESSDGVALINALVARMGTSTNYIELKRGLSLYIKQYYKPTTVTANTYSWGDRIRTIIGKNYPCILGLTSLKAFVKGVRGYFSYYLRRFSLCFCLNNAFQPVLRSQTATMVKKHFDFIICFALLNHKNSIRFVFLRMVILGG